MSIFLKVVAFATMVGAISLVSPGIPGSGIGRLIEAHAAEIVATWDCERTVCTLDSDGVFTVEAKPGTSGSMDYIKANTKPPWQDYLKRIKVIEIKSGVTSIASDSFRDAFNMNNPITVNIADTVTSIGNNAFRNCNLKEVNIYSKKVSIGYDAFYINTNETGNESGASPVINIYGNIEARSSFVSKYWYGGGYRYGTLYYKEGVEDIYIDRMQYIEIPTTAKRIMKNFADDDTFKPTLNIQGDVYFTYIADKAFYAEDITNAEYLHISSDNIEYIGSYLTGITEDIKITNPNCKFGMSAFYNFPKVVEITFDIENIPRSTFYYNKSGFKLNWSAIKQLGISAFKGSKIPFEELPFDKITVIGDEALKDCITDRLDFDVDLSNTESIGESAFSGNYIQKVTLGKATRVEKSFAGMTALKEFVILPEATNTAFDFTDSTLLEKIYWLGPINSAQSTSKIPSTTTIYCQEGSTVEAWCKNNNRAYKLLSDEEVEEIIKGKLPTLVSDSKLFDVSDPSDIVYTVDLGVKPAGATGISKVVVDNMILKSTEYEFNGTDTITIKSDFLKTLSNGTHAISVQFNNGTFRSGASVSVLNSETSGNDTPPDALVTITYEFYKDYPDYVIIPIKMNGATAITQLKIGTAIVDEENYDLQDGAIVLDKEYLLTLDAGKYRVIPTFNDRNNTTISNIKLVVYEEAADRAAPYLLQSRVIFDKLNPLKLIFDSGEGELHTTNVLALIIDNDIILPNGDTLPFSSSAVGDLKSAFALSLEMDKPYFTEKEIEEKEAEKKVEVASPSDATPNEPEIKDDEILDEDIIDEEDTDEPETASPSNAKKANYDVPEENTFLDLITRNITKASVNDEDGEKKLSKREKKLNELAKAMADIEYSDKNMFTVEGNEITVDSDYIDSLGLSEGDHLIGAIFDNTERTTDIKKVILTIQGSETPDIDVPDIDTPDVPDNNDTPDVPDIDVPDVEVPDNNNGGGNHGGSGGGGGSHSGSSTKPNTNGGPNVNNGTINADGSINTNYKSNVPETGGSFSGSGNDWTYTKPDGTIAKNEWVGSNGYWYFIDENGKLKFDWYADNSNNWYMLNREHNGHFGAALTGWYYEKQDGKWYFLNPADSKMLTGWQFINGQWYYLHTNTLGATYVGDNETGWKFTGIEVRPHGSMYVSETTPDGYTVDGSGAWIK